MRKYSYIVFMALVVVGFCGLSACKKTSAEPETPTPPPTTTEPKASGTRAELTKDSIFLYAKELYYWNASLPSYETFNPRAFASNEAELYAMTQYSLDPSTGKPYEYVSGSSEPKYSYFDYADATGKTSALKADLNGTANDYGFSVDYNSKTDVVVKYVYPNSPAAAQGLARGCKITSVNGRTDLTYSSSAINFLNEAIFGSNASVSLSFTDLNGKAKSAVITSSTYTVNPIFFTNVYTVGTKKVGYIVFNAFTNNVSAALTSTFSNFAAQGVTELVVDLRYNGGGYVSTATQLINLAAPASQTGSTMFTTYYNTYLQGLNTISERKASVLVNQPLLDASGALQNFTSGVNGKYVTYADLDYLPTSADNIEKFAKSGSLALSRIYFIVTGSTASASELTINSLRPVMDVKLIGRTTYGKPVGFFPITIDKVDMYIPEFETKNKNGVGGYYSGLTVDKEAAEDLTKSWGDESEVLLAYALLYAKTGSFVTTASKSASLATSKTIPNRLSAEEMKLTAEKLDQNGFKNMIMTPTRKF